MNNKLQTTLLGGLLSASIASPLLAGDFSAPIQVAAPEAADMFSFTSGYHSTYAFRGIDRGDDMVDLNLEAAKTFGCFDLTAGVWQANVINEGLNSDLETRLNLNARKDLGFASLDFGYILYYFDGNTGANTQELYVGLSKEVAGFDLSAKLFYDIDLTDNSYLEFGAAKTFTLAGHDLNASLAIGMNPEDGEFTHAQATVSKSIALNSEVTLTPYVSYSYAIEDGLDSNGAFRDDEFIAGASIGFSF